MNNKRNYSEEAKLRYIINHIKKQSPGDLILGFPEELFDDFFFKFMCDDRLSNSAKLLLFTIREKSLYGFCRDSNKALASHMGCSCGLINANLSRLYKCGYIGALRYEDEHRRKVRTIFVNTQLDN